MEQTTIRIDRLSHKKLKQLALDENTTMLKLLPQIINQYLESRNENENPIKQNQTQSPS